MYTKNLDTSMKDHRQNIYIPAKQNLTHTNNLKTKIFTYQLFAYKSYKKQKI